MYYIAALMCSITEVIYIVLSIPSLIMLGVHWVLFFWKTTLQERREQSDLRSLEGEEKEEQDG